MTWPALSIVIITFNRRDILLGTIRRLYEHLDYAGPRHLIIADDGSPDGTVDAVRELHPAAIIITSNRIGMGANTNAGLRAAFALSEYVLQLQDDMHLQHHFDLHPHVARLRDDPMAGFVRLWGVGGHKYTATLSETPASGSHWVVDWRSDELYIPSDRPQVKHWRFHSHFGFYPEGLRTDQTEDAFCHQCKDRAIPGAPAVLVPHGVDIEKNFEHVGWHDRSRDRGL